MKSWYTIRARGPGAQGSRTEVLIYDEIGAYGVTAKGFLAELGALPDDAAIDLRLNSPGGSVFDAVAIYNALKRHPGEITVWIDGIAASAASYVAMAGDTVVMPENAFLMIHDPSGLVMGTAEDMRSTAEALDKVKVSLIQGYAAKSGKPDEEIAALCALLGDDLAAPTTDLVPLGDQWRQQLLGQMEALLVQSDTAIYCVVIAGIWQSAGFAMALSLAGLRGIDDSIIKAAQIDGASLPLIYWRIILPILRPVVFSTILVLSHLSIKSFDLVMALTAGGPGYATDVPATFMYTMSFTRGQIGLGAASATMMLATVAAIVVPYLYSELRSKPHDR